MDYLDLARCEEALAEAVELGGATKAFYNLQQAYLKARVLHEPEDLGSLEETIPRQVREAFAPLWEMYRAAYKSRSGKKAPRLPK